MIYLLDLAEGVFKHVNLRLVADSFHYQLGCSVRMCGGSLWACAQNKTQGSKKHKIGPAVYTKKTKIRLTVYTKKTNVD